MLNEELKKTFKNLTVISVCPECANRFNNLDKIAFNQNDLIIIVGDKTSANTTSLFEKAKTKLDSKRVLFILNVDELKKVPLPININNIYLTSGTSASAMRQQPPTRASNGSAVPYPCWDVCSITTKADTCSTVRSAATVPPHSPTPETSGRISTPSAQAG